MSLQDAKKTHAVHLLVLEEAVLLSTLITEDLTQLAVTIAPSVKVVRQTTPLAPSDLGAFSFHPSVAALLAGLLALSRESRHQSHFIDPSLAQDAPLPSSTLTRETVMEHVPSVMILHLMRFSYDQYTPVKLFEEVKYPVHVAVVVRRDA